LTISLYETGILERYLDSISKICVDMHALEYSGQFTPKVLTAVDNTLKHLSTSHATKIGTTTVVGIGNAGRYISLEDP